MPLMRARAEQTRWAEPADGFASSDSLLSGTFRLAEPEAGFVGSFEALERLATFATRAHALTCCPCGADHSADLLAHKLSLAADIRWVAESPERAPDGSPESANVILSGEVGNTTGSAALISLGDTVFSQIETAGDQDWFAVTLQAGVTYEFTLSGTGGSPLSDPFLEIMDASGTFLKENDDIAAGSNLNSLLRYTPTTSGTYYLNAHHFGSGTGAYTLTASEAQPLPTYSIAQIADYLVNEGSSGGRRWQSTSLTYNIDGLSAPQQLLAERALAAWSAVTPLTFTRVSSGGNITFTSPATGTEAYAQNTFQGGFITASTIVITDDWQSGDTSFDSYTQQTYIHEVGHALGLGHGGPYNGTATYGTDNVYTNDNWAYTVMSYFDQAEAGHGSYRFVLGLQQADIAGIQQLYNARSGGTFSGNTTFGFNSSAAGTNIDWSQFVLVQAEGTYRRPPSMTIYDTSGVDTIDLSGFSQPQILDLRPGNFSSLGDRPSASQPNYSNVIAIEASTFIENAVGGAGNDRITGNDANNLFDGRTGNDILSSLGGDDTLNGGDGVTLQDIQAKLYRLYVGALGREPDVGGFRFWNTVISNGGTSFSDTVAYFISSPEFTSRFGQPSNLDFVTLLYRNVLNREPDAGGRDFWLNQLNSGMPRTSVVSAFVNSTEFAVQTELPSKAFLGTKVFPDAEGQVFRLYDAALGRAPDAGGFKFWVDMIQAGNATFESAASAFLTSREFSTRYGALNDYDFVRMLYQNILGRQPDPNELQANVNYLSFVGSRSQLLSLFSETSEQVSNAQASLITFMRATDLGWQDTLSGGNGNDTLFGGRGADVFVINPSETGTKTIYGLQAYDTVRLSGFGSTGQFTSALSQQGGDAVFTSGGLTVRFVGTSVATVTSVLQLSSGAEADPGAVEAQSQSVGQPESARAPEPGSFDPGPDMFDFTGLQSGMGAERLTASAAPDSNAVVYSAFEVFEAFEFAGLAALTEASASAASIHPALDLAPVTQIDPLTNTEFDPAGLSLDHFDFSILDRPAHPDWV